MFTKRKRVTGMAVIDIKAVYADMLKCAQILEDIGADVKIAYTDLDDFLNKKMVFNGKQIYANWQSDARAVFEEKAKVIVDVFNKVQAECSEAANTLRAVIKEYENRDSSIASVTLKLDDKRVSALDFKQFGNMESVMTNGKLNPIVIPAIIPPKSTITHAVNTSNKLSAAGDLTGLTNLSVTRVNTVQRVK